MWGVMLFTFILGALLLMGMLHNAAAHRRPGIYPPKRVLRQRAITLGGAGLVFIFIGILIAMSIK